MNKIEEKEAIRKIMEFSEENFEQAIEKSNDLCERFIEICTDHLKENRSKGNVEDVQTVFELYAAISKFCIDLTSSLANFAEDAEKVATINLLFLECAKKTIEEQINILNWKNGDA